MTDMILLWLALPPVLMIAASFMHHSSAARRFLPWTNLLMFIGIVQLFLLDKPVVLWNGLLVADRLNTFVLLISSLVGLAVWLAGLSLNRRVAILMKEYDRFYRFFGLFWLGLMVAILSSHMGLFWIGLELATLSTVYMIRTSSTEPARREAWNYMIVGTIAISLVLFGIILIYASAKDALGEDAMQFAVLMAHAQQIDQPLLFVLGLGMVMLGLMIKLGFFPMNLWLPNIERAAFYPIAALFSGILEGAVMLGFFRFVEIAQAVGDTHLQWIVITFVLLTLLVVAALMYHVKDLMRLFALSGIEHMALIALFWVSGAKFAAVLHLAAHTFLKPALFLATGVLEQQGRYRFRGALTGFFDARGKVFVLLVTLMMLALIGLPPSPMFFSELYGFGGLIAQASPQAPALLLVAALALALIAIIFYKFVEIWQRMRFLDAPVDAPKQVYANELAALLLFAAATLALLWPSSFIWLKEVVA